MDIQAMSDTIHKFAMEELEKFEDAPKSENDTQLYNAMLRKFRTILDPHIYNYLIQTYGSKLDEFWKTHTFPKKSEYAWVLVERRIHPNFWFVLRNLAWAGPYMSLYIFCSDHNMSYLQEMLGDKVNTVHLIPIFKGEGTFDEGYNDYQVIFKRADFYRQIEAEYMLKIELDCYLRHQIPREIFVGDFYGAPWAWAIEKAGGGGLTVHRISAMIELCDKLKDYNTIAIDGWLGDRLMENGYNIPSLNIRLQVFSENFPVRDPIGVHQFWTFLLNFKVIEKDIFKTHLQHYLTIHI
jgi:hypothetical protein